MDSSSCSLENGDDYRSSKRRRFHGDMSIDSLSESFSSHSPFFSNKLHAANKKSIFASTNALATLKRHRSGSASPVQKDLNRVVEEQTAVIESLKSEKKNLESELATLKKDHERSQKENSVLRRAVAIQQERQKNAETQVKAAAEYRGVAEEKIRKLEHLVMALRYHLQTQQNNACNDFMGMPPRPPDVF